MQPFVKMPTDVYRRGLDAAEIAIYGALLIFMNRETHMSCPSIATLSELCGLTAITVRRKLRSLSDKRLVRVEARTCESGKTTSNAYILSIYAGEYERAGKENAVTEERSSSFDIDEFFQAALERTMREGV